MNRKETRKQIFKDIVEQERLNRSHAAQRYCKLVPQDKPIDIAREWMHEHKLMQSLGQPPEHCQWVIRSIGTTSKP